MSFFSSCFLEKLTFRGGFPRLAAVVGCRGNLPALTELNPSRAASVFFSQARLALSPHTFPSTLRPEDNRRGAVALVGALIGTNNDVVQGEPAHSVCII